MMKMIDNHCHFEQLTTQEQQQALRDYTVVAVASDYQSSLQLLGLLSQYDDLHICLGIHPEKITHYAEFTLVAQLIEKHRHQLVGIGEIGLPYFSLSKMAADKQPEVFQQGLHLFEQFIQLAAKFDLTVNLHCVGESTWQAIACLDRYQIKRALFHWFAGDAQLVQAIYQRGWHISVSPDVMGNKRYQQQVQAMPISMLCLESDGPWPYQGKRGMPDMMRASAHQLTSLLNTTANDIIKISQINGQKLWHID
ncbi:TatD DNase family protein [Orbus hercynius]|uniref:TatD DNase family protein n=1 Tax=Orbus hercynius TaxID=593135 RepID=A0A495RBJ2_9GAMM|nr:TatD family hydrolase [Orbus hercynius]RKS84620.1 TatD DNase family protein [Orbus hercynius]